ncbi:MAG TPA: hypothetical protein VKC53_01075 [Patescibacteria group bacterium]|nr:hypothetical protein [Patescibacteria group bacterium]
MKVTEFVSKIFLVIFITLLFQFLFFAFTTTPQTINESDSLGYHIPIATELAKGNFMPPQLDEGLGYYFGGAEFILALFIFLHIPLNLFGVLSWVLLFVVCIKLGKSFGLSREMAIIYAGTVVTLQSVLRWPLTQDVDIWVAVFFTLTLYLIKQNKTSIYDYLKLGITSGLLIGAKISGLPFLLFIFLIFGKDILRKLNIQKSIAFTIPVLVLGLSWPIRNFILTGNPIYPANFVFMHGAPDYPIIHYQDWTLVGNIIKNPRFLLTFLQSINTEFLTWALAIPFGVYLIFKKHKDEAYKLSWLGVSVFVIFATMLLYWPGIEVSNLRLIYPSLAVLILSVFIYFKDNSSELSALALLTSIFSILNLSYHPKLILIGLVSGYIFIFNKKWKYLSV